MLELNGLFAVFGFGCLGGCLAELLHWYELRTSPNLPEYAKKIYYWLITIAMVLAGGLLTSLYSIENVNAILALNIGASAPLMISNGYKAVYLPLHESEEPGERKGKSRSYTQETEPATIDNFIRWK